MNMQDTITNSIGIFTYETIRFAQINEVTPQEYAQAYSDYSDNYKSVHGIRPRWAYGYTMEQFRQAEQKLHNDHKHNVQMARISRKLRHSQQVTWKAKKDSYLTHRSGFSISEATGL